MLGTLEGVVICLGDLDRKERLCPVDATHQLEVAGFAEDGLILEELGVISEDLEFLVAHFLVRPLYDGRDKVISVYLQLLAVMLLSEVLISRVGVNFLTGLNR